MKFSKISTYHLFPDFENNFSNEENLIKKIVNKCQNLHYSSQDLEKEHDMNKVLTLKFLSNLEQI